MGRPSSAGVRQPSVGDVRVRVRGERGVRGVRGEGMLSQVLEPLGGGGGMVTPERWQQPSASDIQASSSFSRSQSGGEEQKGWHRRQQTDPRKSDDGRAGDAP